MIGTKAKPYQTDPRYHEALSSFQKGDWKASQAILEDLCQNYPLENDLREFRPDVSLHSKFDQDEIHDLDAIKDRKIKSLVLRLAVLFALVLLIAYGAYRFMGSIIQTARAKQAELVAQVSEIENQANCRNALSLAASGYPEQAQPILAELIADDPANPCIAQIQALLEQKVPLENLYAAAKGHMERGEYLQAKDVLEEINAQMPNYLDVPLMLDQLSRISSIETLLAEGDAAFRGENWESAVTKYNAARTIDMTYKTSEVEEKLIQSLLNAGESILSKPEISLADLKAADDYFNRALTIRPMNDEILRRQAAVMAVLEETMFWDYVTQANLILAERGDILANMEIARQNLEAASFIRPDDEGVKVDLQLLTLYGEGFKDYANKNWEDAITALKKVVEANANYALGTARQILYECYMSRGNSLIASGQADLALLDYREAAILAEQEPEAVTKLYEAQIKIANALGVTSDYEGAVEMYRSAIHLTGYPLQTTEDPTALSLKLDEAEFYATRDNYRSAYRIYTEALKKPDGFYKYVVHKVERGEYLTSIAVEYGTSVDLIASHNEISNPNRIITGVELLIPVVP